ncbi:MAG TPA: hypothetical protein VMH83_07610 [Candidatus Acidoferrum sp.]|nr:hypothetical protein [Candidatus Acidoferrum sp.]
MMKPIRATFAVLALTITSIVVAQPQQAPAASPGGVPAPSSARRQGAPQPPAGPAPVNAAGRVILGGGAAGDKDIWTPVFGITEPITPYAQIPFQPWSKALFDYRQKKELEPHTRCKASGAARQFLTPYGVEFMEMTELQRMYIFDIGGPHTFRTIYMDGRAHPTDWQPTNYGHSVGHWEGNTLVVDTVGYNEEFWMDRRGMPHTSQLHTIERFTRKDENTVDYRVTIDDPGAYTKTFDGGFSLRWDKGQELFEYVCQQANLAAELMVGDGGKKVDRTSAISP